MKIFPISFSENPPEPSSHIEISEEYPNEDKTIHDAVMSEKKIDKKKEAA